MTDGARHDLDVPAGYAIDENTYGHRSRMLRTPNGSYLLSEVEEARLERGPSDE